MDFLAKKTVEGDLPVEILPEGILSPEISPTGTLPYGIFPEILIGNLPAEISPKSKKEISPKELSLQELYLMEFSPKF